MAAMGGINQLTTGKLISLFEQALVDYDTSDDQGCEGDLMDNACEFIINNDSQTTETIYPYRVDGTCNAMIEAVCVAKITGYEDVPANSESALLKIVANQPVSVSINAGEFDFQFYSGGTFTEQCRTDLDLGLQLGTWTREDRTKYWPVKNSWGTE